MPDLVLEQRLCGELPYVVVRDPSRDPGPYVVVQHGFTGSLDTEIPYGRRFAEAGYTALVTEADLHGLRKSPEGDARLAEDLPRTMGLIVEKSIKEIRSLLDHLGIEKAGYFGISMGGFIGFRLASEDSRVDVLCSLISGPLSFWADMVGDGERIRSLDPLLHPERLRHCALLMLNGVADDTVPIHWARDLHAALKGIVPEDRLKMVEYEGLGHQVTEEMVVEALAWTRRHLPVPT